MDKNLTNRIAKKMIAAKATLAVAESVTSGKIMGELSTAEKATFFFQGGIVAYNLGQKCRQLDLDPILAENVNCVDASVADAMAISIAEKCCSSYGLAITGYAAPVPELGIEKLYAHIAVSKNGKIISRKKINARTKGLAEIQQQYVEDGLKLLEKSLGGRKG